jgi:PAS domain S-box-containing protein
MSADDQGKPLYEGVAPSEADVLARMQATNLVQSSDQRDALMELRDDDVVWAMSPEGRITHVSREVENVRGFTPEEATMQGLDEILTPGSQAVSIAYFMSLIETLQRGDQPQAFRGELEYLCKDGSTVWCDVQTLPHLSAEGELIALYGISRRRDA